MRRLMLGLMLACAASSAMAADVPIENGAVDLLQEATLSQPFTILDQLLLRLDEKAREVAKDIRPENNDFRLYPSLRSGADSTVAYDRSTARTSIVFGLALSGIDDPWRDVCAKHIQRIHISLGLPHRRHWDITGRSFFLRLLGPRIQSDDVQHEAYKVFSDSIAVTLRLWVGDHATQRSFALYCFYDNKTHRVSFLEQRP